MIERRAGRALCRCRAARCGSSRRNVVVVERRERRAAVLRGSSRRCRFGAHHSSPTYSRAGSSNRPGLAAASVTRHARAHGVVARPRRSARRCRWGCRSRARAVRARRARARDDGRRRAAAGARRFRRARRRRPRRRAAARAARSSGGQRQRRARRPPRARASAAARACERRSAPDRRRRCTRIAGESSASAANASPPLLPGPGEGDDRAVAAVEIARSRSAIRRPALRISASSPTRAIAAASAARICCRRQDVDHASRMTHGRGGRARCA